MIKAQKPLLPQDQAAEISLLGSMILESKCIPDIIGVVRSSDFYQQANRLIFKSLIEMYDEVIGIDLVTLKDQLQRRDQLEAVGGIDYLVSLPEQTPSAANAVYYAGIVREKAARREIISAYEYSINIAYDDSQSVDKLVAHFESHLTNIKISPNGQTLQANIITLDTVQAEPIQWLWPQRFAIGKLSLIAGDPGLGKSFITLDMAARLSSGTPWIDCPTIVNPVSSTILLSAEDDPADTIRPRMDAMGADVSKIRVLQAIKLTKDKERMFDLTQDIQCLKHTLETIPDCKLVVIDPISAYLGKTDSHSNADVRGLLAPLSNIAAKHGVAIIAVTHLNKSGGSNPLYRAMGSLAFTAAARVVWAVTKDNDDKERRLILPAKNNLAVDNNGLAYRLIDSRVEWEPNPIERTAGEHFQEMETGGRKAPARDESKAWLSDILQDGPVWADEATEMVKQEGRNMNTVNTAKRELGIISEKVGFGKDAKWYWRLPHQPKYPPVGR
ncbi:MAG: AAA family ATPase [Planctomycetes bacterium]|nr:AAA family ATPase [Planctomycetota bacterium]